MTITDISLCPACLAELPDGYPFDHVAIDRALAGDRDLFSSMPRELKVETLLTGLSRGIPMADLAERWGHYRLPDLLPDEHPQSRASEDAWLKQRVEELWSQGIGDTDIGVRLGFGEKRIRRVRVDLLKLPTRRRRGGKEAQAWKDSAIARASCAHIWPGELTPDTRCTQCGLAYEDWSQAARFSSRSTTSVTTTKEKVLQP